MHISRTIFEKFFGLTFEIFIHKHVLLETQFLHSSVFWVDKRLVIVENFFEVHGIFLSYFHFGSDRLVGFLKAV